MRDDHQSSEAVRGDNAPEERHDGDSRTAVLRILATTDLHAQMLGFDYVNDRAGPHAGFAGLAALIASARTEAAARGMGCLLLDNGDLLQGAPIDRTLAQQEVDAAHPVVKALTHLRYDAVGLGNHDLDHGMPYLQAIAGRLPCPVVCSNLRFSGQTAIRRSALLPCADETGTALRIGIVSALPAKTALWNQADLSGVARLDPIAESVRQATAEVRGAGADIVILLAHLGLEGVPGQDCPGEDARPLAAIPGVDAVILGHTHRRLPGRDHAGLDNVDTDTGRLGAKPSVMAGHDGSDLAVLDLHLEHDPDGGWRVADHTTTLRGNGPDIAPDPVIERLFRPAHDRTRAALARPCGRTERHLHNYFSLAAPTATCALVANAKALAVRNALAGTDEAHLPILAAAAAHTAGGRNGPGHYLHMRPGLLFRRHLAGLSPYGNAIWGLRVTGAELRRWLENAAGVYTRLQPGALRHPLLQNARPSFDHDTIYGLSYSIDPTRPAGSRIVDIRMEGEPLADDRPLILATTSFRAAGGGGGARFGEDKVICRSTQDMTSALCDVLSGGDPIYPLDSRPWRFACPPGVSAILNTAPEALDHLQDIAHLSPVPEGIDPRGFARLRLTL